MHAELIVLTFMLKLTAMFCLKYRHLSTHETSVNKSLVPFNQQQLLPMALHRWSEVARRFGLTKTCTRRWHSWPAINRVRFNFGWANAIDQKSWQKLSKCVQRKILTQWWHPAVGTGISHLFAEPSISCICHLEDSQMRLWRAPHFPFIVNTARG